MSSTIDVIDKYVTPVWYVVGVPGNLLAFVVWTQKKMRASSGCYLTAVETVTVLSASRCDVPSINRSLSVVRLLPDCCRERHCLVSQ